MSVFFSRLGSLDEHCEFSGVAGGEVVVEDEIGSFYSRIKSFVVSRL